MAVDIFTPGGSDPIFPDIAVNPDGSNNDITDPTSGQPNVSTPASPIPLDGWPGNGIPIFSDFNKLFRMITQWIRYLYDLVSKDVVLSGTFTTAMNGVINLPAGYTVDNTIILGGYVALVSGTHRNPLFFNTANTDKSVNIIYAVDVFTSGVDIIQVTCKVDGGSDIDLDGRAYKIVIRKV